MYVFDEEAKFLKEFMIYLRDYNLKYQTNHTIEKIADSRKIFDEVIENFEGEIEE